MSKKITEFEIAVRRLEGKCIDCGVQFAFKETDYCGFCRSSREIENLYQQSIGRALRTKFVKIKKDRSA